jgi:predicted transcriptional regulator of viral defense system
MILNVGYKLDISDDLYHIPSMPGAESQRDRAVSLLKQRGMARLSELTKAGITAATVSRMKEKGLILQLSRGLYQLPGAPPDVNHPLAEAAKLVPKGVICLVSALAFHELTDTIPLRVWMAIGSKDRRPRATHPPLQFVRFGAKVLRAGIEEHLIEGVPVRIYDSAKTVVDLFRYRQRAGKRYQKSPGLNLALEGLREALRQRKATPAEIAKYADEAGIWKVVQPYLDAMTANA